MKLCLIIDEIEEDTLKVKQYVSSMGLMVKTTRFASEALRTCKQSKPDLIILSAQLKDIDATTFLEQLKPHLMGTRCKIIMSSANATAEAVQSAQKAGANLFMLKPIQKEQLRAALDKLDLFD